MEKPRLPCGASRSGGSDLGGEQTRGPEHKGMTAAPKWCTGEKSLAGVLRGADPSLIAGKAEALASPLVKTDPVLLVKTDPPAGTVGADGD